MIPATFTTSDSVCETENEKISTKSYKYYTQQLFDVNGKPAPLTYNRGVFSTDGQGVPSSRIDTSSKMRNSILTSTRSKTCINLGQELPPTYPGLMWGQGDVDIENQLRGTNWREKKSCKKITSNDYIRHFDIFDTMNVNPIACSDLDPDFRKGILTRKIHTKCK